MPSPSLPPPDALLDLMSDTLFVVDEHGRLLYASASCERLLGKKPEDLVGTYRRKMASLLF